MPIFKLSAPKTMRLLGGHILPRNASNFICSHLDLKKFPRGRNPRTPAYRGREGKKRGGEGVNGFLPLKGEGGKNRRGERKGKVGEEKGQQQEGDLAPRS